MNNYKDVYSADSDDSDDSDDNDDVNVLTVARTQDIAADNMVMGNGNNDNDDNNDNDSISTHDSMPELSSDVEVGILHK